MIIQLFEPLREWVYKTRRSKGSKKPSSRFSVEGARASRGGCSHPGTASGEINLRLERPYGQFNTEPRSPEASWLDIKQLTEPQHTSGELISTRQI